MACKHDVIRLNAAHPDWSAGDIANHLDCDPAYVRATGYRNGLSFARCNGMRSPAELRQAAARLLRRADEIERRNGKPTP